MQKILWQTTGYGKKFTATAVTKANEIWNEIMNARRKLIETSADLDSQLADKVLSLENWEDVDKNDLQSALRRITLNRLAVLVLCGSSYKNIGVQLLLDAIVDFLPAPQDVNCPNAEYYDGNLCSLVFKILYDPQRDFVSILRIYSGELNQGQKIYNINQSCTEKIGKIFQIFANDFREIDKAKAGNIVAVTGLKKTITGETIVASSAVANSAVQKFIADKKNVAQGNGAPLLGGLQVPDPVFFCSVEPASLAHQKQLDFALECLKREDPSLKVHLEPETGQTVLSGMGELHLDIIKDRIRNEYKVEAELGPLEVSYKETIQNSVIETIVFDQTVGSTKSHVVITLSVAPSDDRIPLIKLCHSRENQENLARIWQDHLKALESGIRMTLQSGPILAFPVVNIKIGIHWLEVERRSSLPSISAAASKCVATALQKALPTLLEPFMKLEVIAPRQHLHDILGDLANRRGQILQIADRQNFKVVEALVPLAELKGYSTTLRIITSGLATFSMTLDSYNSMSAQEQEKAVRKVTGFL